MKSIKGINKQKHRPINFKIYVLYNKQVFFTNKKNWISPNNLRIFPYFLKKRGRHFKIELTSSMLVLWSVESCNATNLISRSFLDLTALSPWVNDSSSARVSMLPIISLDCQFYSRFHLYCATRARLSPTFIYWNKLTIMMNDSGGRRIHNERHNVREHGRT